MRSATLASEVTRLVHGADAVREAESAAEKLFKGDLAIDVGRRAAAGVQQCALVADAVSIRGLARDGVPRRRMP